MRFSDRLCSVRQPPPTNSKNKTMTSDTWQLDLESAAKEAAGNWQHFDCFCWYRKRTSTTPTIGPFVYTHHRDSGLLDQSNAEVIAEAMEKFTKGDDPDVVFESHFHWAVGHVDGFSVRVYRRGRITEAFRTYHELRHGWPNTRCWTKRTIRRGNTKQPSRNISDAAWRLKREYDLARGLGGSGLPLALGP